MRSKSLELILRIREYIESYFERYSSTPTVREIAGAMKIAVSSAHRYLVAMAEKDMVFYEKGTLSTPKIRRMNPAVSPAAIVGSIPCGSPEEKEAQVEEYLPLSVSFFGKGDFYALRASGSSMTGGRRLTMGIWLSSGNSTPPRLGRSSLPSPTRTRTR